MNLYIIGFVDPKSPRVLINPGYCENISKVFEYLETHELANVISEKRLSEKLSGNALVEIELEGFKEALLIGTDHIINQSTDRFVCTGNKRFYPIRF